MADTITIYPKGIEGILKGTIDLSSATIKVLLVNTSYTYSNAHDFADDVGSAEYNFAATASGYQAGYSGTGRQTIGNKTVTTSSNTVTFDGDDVVFSSINTDVTAGDVKGAIIYKHGVADSSSPLIAYVSFGSVFTPSGADLTLKWNASGIFTAS